MLRLSFVTESGGAVSMKVGPESRPVGLTRHLKLKIDKGKSNVNANNQRTAARSRLG